jgi:hypothetical protein
MARVYSTELLAVQGLDADATYTAPPGSTVVIREVDVYWGGGVTANVSFRLIGSVGQTIWEVHVNASVPPYDSRSWQWQGRAVLEAGETFTIRGTGDLFDATVSGYVLGP